VKRLLALLLSCVVLVAGCGKSRPIDAAGGDTLSGEADTDEVASPDGGDDTADGTATTTTEPPSPTTTADAGDVAATIEFGDGATIELLHGETNDIAVPTRENQEFVDLVYQGVVPAGFDGVVLSQRIVQAVMEHELAGVGVEVAEVHEAEASELLVKDLENILLTTGVEDTEAEAARLVDEVPYLPFIVGLQARQLALAQALLEEAGPGVGDPCSRHILVGTEAEADEVLEELEAGAEFAALAADRSIDSSAATNGGDLGCLPASTFVGPFADAITDAPIGEYLGPVETEFGFHVIVVDGYDGGSLAEEAITTGLRDATIVVDERVGQWDDELLTILSTEE
jgi:hypothetical protein